MEEEKPIAATVAGVDENPTDQTNKDRRQETDDSKKSAVPEPKESPKNTPNEAKSPPAAAKPKGPSTGGNDQTPQNDGTPPTKKTTPEKSDSASPPGDTDGSPMTPSHMSPEEMPPIVLSNTGWASNHPGLLQLVKDHMDEYTAETASGVTTPVVIETVSKIVQKLVAEFSPTILAVDDTVETEDGRPRSVRLENKRVLSGGSHYLRMAKKVHECYLLVQQDGPEYRALIAQTFDSPALKHGASFQESDTDPSSRRLKTASKASNKVPRRSHRTVRPTAKKNPYAKSYKTSGDEASSTPKRKQQKRSDIDETPVAGNRAKKSRTSTNSSIVLNLPKTIEVPVVNVDELCYDWSSLKLDGTGAWNRLLLEQMDPAISPAPPQVTAMDTYQLMQNLREGLKTIAPPKDSPLWQGYHDPDVIPENCPEGLKPVLPQMSRLFQNMVKFENGEDRASRVAYQYKTPSALREHMIETDRHAEELKAHPGNSTAPRGPSRLAAIQEQLKRRREAQRNQKKKPPGTVPVFWQEDFQALLNNKGTATHYLMIQDEY